MYVYYNAKSAKKESVKREPIYRYQDRREKKTRKNVREPLPITAVVTNKEHLFEAPTAMP